MSGLQTAAPVLQASTWIAQHAGDRPAQHDRAAVFSDPTGRCQLALVADGSGRGQTATVAGDNVLLAARRSFEQFDPSPEGGARFLRTLVSDTHTVLCLAGMTAGLSPRSTLAALLVQPGRVDFCHVGDTRIYHIRQRRLAWRTADHNQAQRLVERQGLPFEAALRHPQARQLTQALGTAQPPEPTLRTIEDPQAGDTFVLCSDGLWEYFHAGEIVMVTLDKPLGQAADTLMRRARDRAGGRGDNCSLVLVRLSEAPPAARRRR